MLALMMVDAGSLSVGRGKGLLGLISVTQCMVDMAVTDRRLILQPLFILSFNVLNYDAVLGFSTFDNLFVIGPAYE